MDRILLLLCLCLKYATFAEVKDNETLIYHWDVHHKIYYYCQFGTTEQIKLNFERQCFRRNKQMQHVLPDGTITFPYMAYGSDLGFVLKCRDLPHAELHNCSKMLYTTCKYTCPGSGATRDITCELRGPHDNVTAQWSVSQPCSDSPGPVMQPVTQLTSSPGNSAETYHMDTVSSVGTTRVTVLLATTNNNPSSESQTSPAIDLETSTVKTLKKFPYTTVFASAIAAVIFLLVVVILLFLLYKYLRKRRRKQSQIACKQLASPDNEINSFKDNIIIYSELDVESKQPLVDIEGEDNHLQKSLSDSETNTSKESSEAIHGGADENEEHNEDTGIEEYLNNFESMGSRFSSWEKMKQLIEDDQVHVPEQPPARPQPEQCCASVSQLLEQAGSYRRNLRAQLEVISGRTREQALIGYMEQRITLYGFQSRNELKVHEQTYERQVDEKVSDFFLRRLAGYGVKIGYILEYFYQHKNWDAINVILQVHTGCPYCEMFRMQRELCLYVAEDVSRPRVVCLAR